MMNLLWDLSPITVYEVKLYSDRRRLVPHKPVVLIPTTSSSGRLIEVRLDPYLDCFALTRDDLVKQVYDEISLVWTEYAEAEDQDLTKEAVDLKLSMLQLFQVFSF